MYVCMYVCVYADMYVCMYVCATQVYVPASQILVHVLMLMG